jgi:hypothetical protein
MFAMQQLGKTSHADEKILKYRGGFLREKVCDSSYTWLLQTPPLIYLFSKMQQPEKNGATKNSTSEITSNPRKGSSKDFPSIKLKKINDFDVQKNCDSLVLDCFYDWVGNIQSGKTDPDNSLLKRLRKVKIRFIETI